MTSVVEPVVKVRLARRRSLATGFTFAALVLIPWSMWLAATLPRRTAAYHWSAAWTGFDLMLSIALAGMAVALWRGSPWLLAFAGAAAGLLLSDVWFDVLTSSAQNRPIAIGEAVLFEIPLFLVCLRVASRARHKLEALHADPVGLRGARGTSR